MAITALPTPPSRSDPANFPERADAFMAALPGFAQESNQLQEQVNQAAQVAGENAAAAGGSAQSAGQSSAQAGESANAAIAAADLAGQRAAASTSAANLAAQWATKTGAPVSGGEFSAKHYAQLAAQGMGLPVFPPTGIPTVNVGPIFIAGAGDAEWDLASGSYRTQVDFALIYPGGTRATPGVINGNTVQIVENPFPGFVLHVVAEHMLSGQWFETGWFSSTDRSASPSDPFSGWGLKAAHDLVTDKIIVRAGKNGTATDPAIAGGSWVGAWPGNQINAKFRIKVWKIKGKING